MSFLIAGCPPVSFGRVSGKLTQVSFLVYFTLPKIETENIKPLYIGQEMLGSDQLLTDAAQGSICNA